MNNKTLNIKKYLVLLQIIVVVFSLGLFSFSSVDAATLSELQQKQNELSSQIDDNNAKIEHKKQEIGTISTDINIINNNINTALQKIKETDGQIETTKHEIQEVKNEIEQQEKEIAHQEENQAETLRIIYESFKDSSVVKMVIGSSTLSQLINYSSYLEALQNKIESIIDEITLLKQELEQKRQQLEDKQKEQEQLQEQNRAYKRGLDEQKGVKNMLLSNKESEKQSLEEQIAEVRKLRSQVEAQIASAIAASRQGTGISPKDKGVSAVGFMWPVSGQITAYFNDPEYYAYFGFSHYGLDIANAPGTPIYAAASGTITTVASVGSYGNSIIIGHNARFVSLYAHLMSFAVSAGDEVQRGQVIGYMGSTGFSTGPHLHFEIREYGTPKDPLIFLP